MASGEALNDVGRVGWRQTRSDPLSPRFGGEARRELGPPPISDIHMQACSWLQALQFKFVKLDFRGRFVSSDTDSVAFPCPTRWISNEQRKHLDAFIGSSCRS